MWGFPHYKGLLVTPDAMVMTVMMMMVMMMMIMMMRRPSRRDRRETGELLAKMVP